jgi:hypothetical protein
MYGLWGSGYKTSPCNWTTALVVDGRWEMGESQQVESVEQGLAPRSCPGVDWPGLTRIAQPVLSAFDRVPHFEFHSSASS